MIKTHATNRVSSWRLKDHALQNTRRGLQEAQGDFDRGAYPRKLLKSRVPGLTFAIEEESLGFYGVYILDANEPQGKEVVGKVWIELRRLLHIGTAAYLLPRAYYEVHSDLLPAYRGKGLVGSLYALFLRSGQTVMTNGHSADADRLWTALGRTFEQAWLEYNPRAKTVTRLGAPSKNAFRALLGPKRKVLDLVPVGWRYAEAGNHG